MFRQVPIEHMWGETAGWGALTGFDGPTRAGWPTWVRQQAPKPEHQIARRAVDDLVVIAEFRDPIYPGLVSTGRVERGGDWPFHAVINAEKSHALQFLLYTHDSRPCPMPATTGCNTAATRRRTGSGSQYRGRFDRSRAVKEMVLQGGELRLRLEHLEAARRHASGGLERPRHPLAADPCGRSGDGP